MTRRAIYGWAGELALIGLTASVTIGMQRLFIDNSYLRDALALAVASHLVAIAARRAGLGMIASGLLSIAAAVVTLTVLLYAETANIILPTRETWDLLWSDLQDGWTVFSEEKAPVPVVPGFVVTIGALMWIVAFLADWAAFRLRSPLEAVAPAGAVFVFTALLGAETDQILHGALFAAAATATLLTMRVNRQAREEVWIEPAGGRGPGATLRLGALAGTAAVLVGVIFGPLLPGAGDPGLVDVTSLDDGPDTRVVVSPLVEVQAKIVQQAQFELFAVQVARGDNNYWRLMSLDEFDGDLWKASSNFEPADGPVESDLDASVPTRQVVQTVNTTPNLGNIYLPLAFELSEVIDDGGIDLEYEVDSASLVVTRESYADSLDGFTYTIESKVPVVEPPRLRSATTESLGSGFLDHYTDLPGSMPESVVDEARRITAGATNDYDRALALQNHLRTFTYNINVALEHDVDNMETFLFDVQEGYCEQFANAFAAMARSLGLPTRLAVGFTWGDWSDARGEYVVRGEHAHAWPEVYFAGTGWVPFEPTPGRGSPTGQQVTGVAEAQAGDEVVTPPVTIAPNNSIPTDGPTGPTSEFPPEPGFEPTLPAPEPGESFPIARTLIITALVVLVVSFVPGLRAAQRRVRAAKVAHDPKGRIELAWDDALEALEMVDIRYRPQETPTEFAGRVDSHRRDLRRINTLAESTTVARYSPDIDDRVVRDAEDSAAAIRATCHENASMGRKTMARFDPRPLVKN